ncbi:MAG: hypothetical protein Q8P31_09605 [Bacillota bacterium]|nr:hypothetical protein [Bacillota bacterium]
MLNAGTAAKLVFFCLFMAVVYWGMKAVRRGVNIRTKQLPGLTAIDEAVGRATELGRPFFANIQASGPHIEDQVLASCELVRYAVQSAVRYEAPFMCVSNSPDGHPIFEEIISSAYMAAGKPELYNPNNVRFIGGFSSGTHVQIMQLMKDENIAAQLISGNLMNQTMFFAETGAALGAIQIGATKNTHQMPFLAMQCDYSLLGDDLYAAATMISRDPVRMGCLTAQETGKALALVVIVVGVVARLMGSNAVVDILRR